MKELTIITFDGEGRMTELTTFVLKAMKTARTIEKQRAIRIALSHADDDERTTRQLALMIAEEIEAEDVPLNFDESLRDA